ncbi:MAG: hypothetical protein OXI01_01905, partial [Albidovulum sp.]|nr:hypothetical protein [Albidovulum sp.]
SGARPSSRSFPPRPRRGGGPLVERRALPVEAAMGSHVAFGLDPGAEAPVERVRIGDVPSLERGQEPTPDGPEP